MVGAISTSSPNAKSLPGFNFCMFSDRARQHHRFRREQPAASKRTTRFYDTYSLDTLDGAHTISLSLGDTILLHDDSLLTIHHFEHEYDESTLDNNRLDIQVFVIGAHFNLFSRCDDLGGFLATDRREVYLTSEKKRYNTNLINRKVKLIKTNAPYPAFRSEPPYITYTCRYMRMENSVIALTSSLSDPGRTRLDETRKRNRFLRKPTKSSSPHPSGRYTFGDAFSGVGGCSAGARKAGFHISWAFDGDKDVCELYAENFINADVFMARADEFLVLNNKEKLKVDLLHMSPPCQTWSMAHTVQGKDDDANSASLFAVKELLQFARPRIATIEQVPGLLSQNNRYELLPVTD